MKGKQNRLLMLVVMVVFLSCSILQMEVFARAGGGRSSGFRSSRSYSSPARSYTTPYSRPSNNQYGQSNRGGVMSGLLGGVAGGMAGGLLGSMLFGGHGGGNGGGGGGLLPIIIFAGIGYFVYKAYMKKKSEGGFDNGGSPFNPTVVPSQNYQNNFNQQELESGDDLQAGLSGIRRMDSSFDETRFSDQVMDLFFKIQGSVMNRDLLPVKALLTDEMYGFLQGDVDKLISEKKVNRLENIAVRKVEIDEAWQEMGKDNITTLIYANLLDYTTDDTTGAVVSGSKVDPVKFEEYWSFIRPTGNNPWRLAGIDQK